MFDKMWVRLVFNVLTSIIYIAIGFIVAAVTKVNGMMLVAYSMVVVGVLNSLLYLLIECEGFVADNLSHGTRTILFYVLAIVANGIMIWLNTLYAKEIKTDNIWLLAYVMATYIMAIAVPYVMYILKVDTMSDTLPAFAILVFPILILLMWLIMLIGTKVPFIRSNGMLITYILLALAFAIHAGIEGYSEMIEGGGAILSDEEWARRNREAERYKATTSSTYSGSSEESASSAGGVDLRAIDRFLSDWCYEHSGDFVIEDVGSVKTYAKRDFSAWTDNSFGNRLDVRMTVDVYYHLYNSFEAKNEINTDDERYFDRVVREDQKYTYKELFGDLQEELEDMCDIPISFKTSVNPSMQENIEII